MYAPPDNPVFDLVPPEIDEALNWCYDTIGRPVVHLGSAWDVYSRTLAAYRHYVTGVDAYQAGVLQYAMEEAMRMEGEKFDVAGGVFPEVEVPEGDDEEPGLYLDAEDEEFDEGFVV